MPNESRRKQWYKKPEIIVPAIVAIILAIIGGWWGYHNSKPQPDFNTIINPSNGVVESGGIIQSAITVEGLNGYKNNVSLSASNQPANMVVSFTPSSGDPRPTYTSNMLISIGANVPTGKYTIEIKGVGADGKKHACEYTLLVMAPTQPTTTPPLATISPPAPTPSPFAVITYPATGAQVEIQETIIGTSTNIPANYAIWVVVYLKELQRYFPQDAPSNMNKTGDWSSAAFIGNASDTKKTFEIIVVLADSATQNTFNSYLEQSKNRGSWAGLAKLPDSAIFLNSVIVIRK